MTRKIFITATGTDVGKTYVSALIVKSMREAGYNCGYYKPVLSGVEEIDGRLIKSDCNYVVDTAQLPDSADNCVTYWWKEAVSPHLASKRAGEVIDTSRIRVDFENACKKYDYLLVEGAGGITCPLRLDGEKYLLKDLIKDLGMDIIIIADGGLGTINSTLLTVEYARANGINIQGIILNNYIEDDFMYRDNLLQSEYLTGIKVIETVSPNCARINVLEKYFI